jgi:hypothetical protein
MTQLDWTKAQRRAAHFKPAPVKGLNSPPITARQRAYIERLQREMGTAIPMPPSKYAASNVIEFLLRLRASASRPRPAAR